MMAREQSNAKTAALVDTPYPGAKAKVSLLIIDDCGLKPMLHPMMKTSTTSSPNVMSEFLPC
jgi:hypothetical protein